MIAQYFIYDRLHQILPGHPKKLFLLAGVNDISHDLTADSIVSMIRMTVERIQRESPDTKLYLQSLLPFDESFGRYKKLTGKTNMVPEINAQLEVLAKDHKITFINLFPLFTEKGTNVLRLIDDGKGRIIPLETTVGRKPYTYRRLTTQT